MSTNWVSGSSHIESLDGRQEAFLNRKRIKIYRTHKRPLHLSHSREFQDLIFSPDSRILAAKDDQNTLFLWNITGDKPQEIFHCPQVSSPLHSSLFIEGESRITLGHTDNTLALWDYDKQKKVSIFIGDKTPASHLFLLKGGAQKRQLLSIGEGGREISRWDLSELDGRSIQVPRAPITTTLLIPDSVYLISTTAKGDIWGWDRRTGEGLFHLETGEEGIPSLARSRDGRRLWTLEEGREIGVWDLSSKERLEKITLPKGMDWLFLNEKEVPLLVNRRGEIQIFDGDQRGFIDLEVEERSPKWITKVHHIPEKDLLVLLSPEGVFLFQIDVANRRCRINEVLEVEDISAMGSSFDGEILLMGNSGGVQLWNVDTSLPLNVFPLHGGSLTQLCPSPCGSFFLSANTQGELYAWDLKTGKALGRCKRPPRRDHLSLFWT